MAMQPATSGSNVERPGAGTLSDVITTILDKGLVIDVYARVSLVGIELLRADVRVVVASVDTYLRFAEAVNRLDLQQTELAGLPELQEKGAEKETEGAIEGVKEAVTPDSPTVREAAKALAAGAAIAGATAAAKTLTDRFRGADGD